MVEWRPDWYENVAGSKLNSLVIRELAVHLCDNRRRWGFQDGQPIFRRHFGPFLDRHRHGRTSRSRAGRSSTRIYNPAKSCTARLFRFGRGTLRLSTATCRRRGILQGDQFVTSENEKNETNQNHNSVQRSETSAQSSTRRINCLEAR
jgi:hypothetical protein